MKPECAVVPGVIVLKAIAGIHVHVITMTSPC